MDFHKWRVGFYLVASALGAAAAISPPGLAITLPVLGAVALKTALGSAAAFFAGWATKTVGDGKDGAK